jgi:hypothetical protein
MGYSFGGKLPFLSPQTSQIGSPDQDAKEVPIKKMQK